MTVPVSPRGHRFYDFRQPQTPEIWVGAAGYLVIGVLRVQLAHKAENDIFGGEGARRAEMSQLMERHVLAKPEFVSKPILRDRPGSGERRFDFRLSRLVGDQPVIELARRRIERRLAEGELRIEDIRAFFGTEHERLHLCGGPARERHPK